MAVATKLIIRTAFLTDVSYPPSMDNGRSCIQGGRNQSPCVVVQTRLCQGCGALRYGGP